MFIYDIFQLYDYYNHHHFKKKILFWKKHYGQGAMGPSATAVYHDIVIPRYMTILLYRGI